MCIIDRITFINEVLANFKEQGAINLKYTEGTRGLHVDFKTCIDDVWQYSFIKFKDSVIDE